MGKTLQSAVTTEELIAALDADGIKIVHTGIFDIDGVFREKRLPVSRAVRAIQQGWSFINALPYWDAGDATFAERGFRDEPCLIDPSSGRSFPFESDAAVLVADYDGPSKTLSPREILKTQIARADSMGFEARAATEFEFLVLNETVESLKAKRFDNLEVCMQHNRCWSGLTPATHSEFIAELDETLSKADIPLDHLCMELGPGCFEATLPCRSALKAADDAAFFKLYTKAFCRRRKLTASFMAKLANDFPGLGGHPILSLWDKRSEQPVFAGDANRQVSTTASHFIGGLLTLLPELMVMSAHTVNSYRRLAPGNWAPRTATWGIGNYTCAARFVLGSTEETRLEFRLPAADVNSHLGFAMMLAAGLYGIQQRIEPPPPTEGTGREVVHDSIGPLPRTLLEAAERFERSEIARKLFGDTFVDHFVKSRKHEDWTIRRQVTACERERYLDHV